MRYVDLSHSISDGMITYKGLPAPVICDYYSREESRKFYEEGTSFQIGKVDMVGNTGTYIDCPYHRFENGHDFSELFLSDLTDLPGCQVSVPFEKTIAIDREFFENLDIENKAVLVHTGWSRHWRTEKYFDNHPYLTEEAALFLKANKVRLVGIDSHNIDDTRMRTRPVHTILLSAGILIVEHLCQLHLLPQKGFLFTAVPPKIKKTGSFPVRAFAKF